MLQSDRMCGNQNPLELKTPKRLYIRRNVLNDWIILSRLTRYFIISKYVDKLLIHKIKLKRYFPNKDTLGVFIECGAFDGLTENSCKFFEETMNWKGYNIEPVPWIYEKLCKNRPESKNFNFALSNKNGEAIFKAVDHPTFGVDCTNGSLNHTQAHSSLLKEIGCQIVETKVQVKTWHDFIAQENITNIDLLVLDVEGHELSVIEGMRGSAVLPDIICIEVGHLCFDDIRRELHGIGYTYDVSSHVNAFFIKNDIYHDNTMILLIGAQILLFTLNL